MLTLAAEPDPAPVTRIERLVMPGDLIAGHAKYENQCEKCHELLDRKAQSRLCRNCHDAVEVDIQTGKGFHGRIPDIGTAECRHCHTDHEGRKTDIVLLDQGTFRHDQTDFGLKGAHREVECAGCHKEGKKHREAPHTCIECHKEDDNHRGRLGEKCTDCHNEESWRKTRFDHDKTKFPLKDRHRNVPCSSCHPDHKYKDLPRTCAGCHRLNDPHATRYGDKCDKCHSEKDWRTVKFDHDRDTKYRLEGRHVMVDCDTCHPGDLYKDKLKTECHACHKNDDQHRGRNGEECKDCHSVNGWGKVEFDHDKDTKYPLEGRHKEVGCNACHREGSDPKKVGRACVDCHETDDRHHGEFGRKCATCHKVEDWKKLSFDHDKDTKFPLKGRHKKAKCNTCHKDGDYEKELGRECIDCHKPDDVHKGQQGRECHRCHNEDSWRERVRFEHDLTRFPLVGLHAVTACEECHPQAIYKDTPRACVKCHENDDVHRQRLGEECASCHNPNDWKLWQFDHDTRTKYKLDGKHRDLSCVACHVEPLAGKPKLPKDCFGCHEQDDVHEGAFGENCERCHVTRSFTDVDVRQNGP